MITSGDRLTRPHDGRLSTSALPSVLCKRRGDLYFAGERTWIMGPPRYGHVTFVYRFDYRAGFSSNFRETLPSWLPLHGGFGLLGLHRPLHTTSASKAPRPPAGSTGSGSLEPPPLRNYGDLSAEDVETTVKGPSKQEIREILGYENQHQNRKSLVESLDRKV